MPLLTGFEFDPMIGYDSSLVNVSAMHEGALRPIAIIINP